MMVDAYEAALCFQCTCSQVSRPCVSANKEKVMTTWSKSNVNISFRHSNSLHLNEGTQRLKISDKPVVIDGASILKLAPHSSDIVGAAIIESGIANGLLKIRLGDCKKDEANKWDESYAVVLVEKTESILRIFLFVPESYEMWLSRRGLGVPWNVYNQEVTLMYRRLVAAVENSTAVLARTRSILESESQFMSDADAMGSYSHLQDVHSGRLLGTVSIKGLHIDGLHDAVAEIDKRLSKKEAKECCVRLIFSIEVKKSSQKYDMLSSWASSCRWRNSFAAMLNGAKQGDQEEWDLFRAHATSDVNGVTSTANSITWPLLLDATTSLKHACFEIPIRREIKVHAKTNHEEANARFRSKCILRIELKAKLRNKPCILVSTSNVPLKSLLNNVWVAIDIGEVGLATNLGPMNDSVESVHWKFPSNVPSSSMGSASFSGLSKFKVAAKKMNIVQKSKGGFSQDGQKKKKSGATLRDVKKRKQGIEDEVVKRLKEFSVDMNENSICFCAGVDRDSKHSSLEFLDQEWLQSNMLSFHLHREPLKHATHMGTTFAQKHFFVDSITLTKPETINVKYITYLPRANEKKELFTNPFSISFQILYSMGKDIKVVTCGTAPMKGAPVYTGRVEDGQFVPVLPHIEDKTPFVIGVSSTKTALEIANVEQGMELSALMDICDTAVTVYGESGTYNSKFREFASWKKVTFEHSSVPDNLRHTIKQVTASLEHNTYCEKCQENAFGSGGNVNVATHKCIYSVTSEKQFQATISDLKIDEDILSLDYSHTGEVKIASLDANSDSFPELGETRYISKDIYPAKVISKTNDFYVAEFEDKKLRRFPIHDWMVVEIGMMKHLPKSMLITDKPNSVGHLCKLCFLETHDMHKSIWIDMTKSNSSERRDFALVPLKLAQYHETDNMHLKKPRVFEVENYFELHMNPFFSAKKVRESDCLLWAGVMRRWRDHGDAGTESNFKDNQISFHPNPDSLELELLAKQTDELRRLHLSVPGHLTRSMSFMKMVSSAETFYHRIQSFMKEFRTRPINVQSNLKSCLSFVRRRCDYVLQESVENLRLSTLESISAILDSCKNKFFGEIEVRNIDHDSLNIDRFGHTASLVGHNLVVIGGIRANFTTIKNKANAVSLPRVWTSLAHKIDSQDLCIGAVTVVDLDIPLQHNVHVHGKKFDLSTLKRSGHTAVVNESTVIVFGGFTGVDNSQIRLGTSRRGASRRVGRSLCDLKLLDTEGWVWQNACITDSARPKIGRSGHSASLISQSVSGREYKYMLLWGGQYGDGRLVGQEENDEELLRLLDCSTRNNYKWVDGAFDETRKSWKSSSYKDGKIPRLSMKNIGDAPTPLTNHCSVVLHNGEDVNAHTIVFFSGFEKLSDDIPSKKIFLLHVNSDSLQIVLEWERVNHRRIRGDAPNLVCNMHSVTVVGRQILVFSEHRVFTLERIALNTDQDVWQWRSPSVIGPMMPCFGATFTKLNEHAILCLGGVKRLDTREKDAEAQSDLVEDQFVKTTSETLIPRLIFTSRNTNTENFYKKGVDAVDIGNTKLEKIAIHDSLLDFFGSDEDAVWWMENFGDAFAAPVDSVVTALHANASSPLYVLKLLTGDLQILRKILNVHEDGMVDLYTMKSLSGSYGILHSFVLIKLRHEYLLKPEHKDVEWEHFHAYHTGNVSFMTKEFMAFDRLKYHTENMLQVLSKQSSGGFVKTSRVLTKQLETSSESFLIGGIYIAFSAFKLCVSMESGHIHVEASFIDEVVHFLTSIDMTNDEDKMLATASGEFLKCVARNDGVGFDLKEHISLNSLRLLVSMLQMFAVEANESFPGKMYVSRLRTDLCIFFKMISKRHGYPTLNDLFNIEVLPSIMLLRKHSWGYDSTLLKVCEEVLQDMLGVLPTLDLYTQENYLEYFAIDMLAQLKDQQISVGIDVLAAFKRAQADISGTFPYAIVLNSSTRPAGSAKLAHLGKQNETMKAMLDSNQVIVIDLLTFSLATESFRKAAVEEAEDEVTFAEQTLLTNEVGKCMDNGHLVKARLKLSKAAESSVNCTKYIIQLKEMMGCLDTMLNEFKNRFVMHIQSLVKFVMQDAHEKIDITSWNRTWRNLENAMGIEAIMGTSSAHDKVPMVGFMFVVVEILRCSHFCLPALMVDLQLAMFEIIIFVATASALLNASLQSQNMFDRYMEDAIHAGILSVLLDIVSKNHTILRSNPGTNLNGMNPQTFAYFDRGNKLVDRYASLALFCCLRYLPFHFHGKPGQFTKLKRLSESRRILRAPFVLPKESFVETLVEVMHEVITNLPNLSPGILYCEDISNLAEQILEAKATPTSLRLESSVSHLVSMVKIARGFKSTTNTSIKGHWWEQSGEGLRDETPHSVRDDAYLTSIIPKKSGKKSENIQGIKNSLSSTAEGAAESANDSYRNVKNDEEDGQPVCALS